LDMTEFLQNYEEKKRGNVLNEKGEAIGWHDGAIFYTLGSRHGFTITKKGSNEAPYFIIAKDILANTLTVANKEKGSLKGKGKQTVLLENVNWISGVTPVSEKIFFARTRYRAELFPCKISLIDKKIQVKFLDPQEPEAPGQSLVVYDGEECLGGGVIV